VTGRLGCQTTARVRDGVPDFARRHVDRLQRDAPRLGLAAPEADQILEAFHQLGRAVFADREGIVRLEVRPATDGRPHLIGRARGFGDSPAVWRAVIAPFVHPGPGTRSGIKLTEHPCWARGRAHATEHGVDEVGLADADGHLVEGARSALLIVDAAGTVSYPDPALGGVASIGLAVLTDRIPELAARRIPVGSLPGAREVLAVNAVRGVCAVLAVDDREVADGTPGPVARRLAAVFDAAIQEESRSAR
jgi:D-alanine transaminase